MIALTNDKLKADKIFWTRLLAWRLSYKEVKKREGSMIRGYERDND